MTLSISNIAWDVTEDDEVAALLKQYGVGLIDVAPPKYFPSPATVTEAEAHAVRDAWKARGFGFAGMQSLLFGTTGLNVFGSEEVQTAMLDHLRAICNIGGWLGATRLVFGSPRNRDRSGLSDAETLETARRFFTRLGDIAQEAGVIICLEPNPERYGANFMTTAAETAAVTRHIAHPAVKMQFDTGALTISGEDPAAFLAEHHDLIGHVHLSEPDLAPIGDKESDHTALAAAIRSYLPHHTITIEMVATKDEPHLPAITRALETATRFYTNTGAQT